MINLKNLLVKFKDRLIYNLFFVLNYLKKYPNIIVFLITYLTVYYSALFSFSKHGIIVGYIFLIFWFIIIRIIFYYIDLLKKRLINIICADIGFIFFFIFILMDYLFYVFGYVYFYYSVSFFGLLYIIFAFIYFNVARELVIDYLRKYKFLNSVYYFIYLLYNIFLFILFDVLYFYMLLYIIFMALIIIYPLKIFDRYAASYYSIILKLADKDKDNDKDDNSDSKNKDNANDNKDKDNEDNKDICNYNIKFNKFNTYRVLTKIINLIKRINVRLKVMGGNRNRKSD